jgi:hypothetical protein
MTQPFTTTTHAEGLIIVVHYAPSFDVIDDLPAVKDDLQARVVHAMQQHGPGHAIAFIHDARLMQRITLNDVRYGVLSGFDIPLPEGLPLPTAVYTYIVSTGSFFRDALRTIWNLLNMVGIKVTLVPTLDDALRAAAIVTGPSPVS